MLILFLFLYFCDKSLKQLKSLYTTNFDKLFVKIKGRPNQDWITEVYEERKQDNETCGDNVSLFIEKTLS